MNEVTTENIINSIRSKTKDTLKLNKNDSFIFNTDSSFFLSEINIQEDSIKVYINDEQLLDEWSYDPYINKVSITDDITINDNILIVYNYYPKYSDVDITNSIVSVLMYFVQYRYKKYFYFKDGELYSREFDSEDETPPTPQEAEIISILASIFLEPDNFNIKTLDFSLSGNKNASINAQIEDVFVKWLKNYGF